MRTFTLKLRLALLFMVASCTHCALANSAVANIALTNIALAHTAVANAALTNLVGKSEDAQACLETLLKRQDELTAIQNRLIGNTPVSVQTTQQRDLARLIAAVNPLPASGTQPIALIDCNRTVSDLVAALRYAKQQVSVRQ